MIKTSQLIANIEQAETGKTCAICGNNSAEHNLYDHVSSNFTNQNVLLDKEIIGAHICEACRLAFKSKCRRSSYIINEQQQIFFRNNEGLQYLINPIAPPFIFGVTKNFKKHTWLFCKVNHNRDSFYIGTDFSSEAIFFDRLMWLDIIPLLQKLYEAGFSKKDLRTLNPSLHRFKQIEDENIIEDWYKKHYLFLSQFHNNLAYEIILMLMARPEKPKANKSKKESNQNERDKQRQTDTPYCGDLFSSTKGP